MKSFFRLLFPALCLLGLASTLHAQIAAKVQRAKIAGIDLIAYPTGVKDVVTFHGSLPAGDAMAGDGNVAIPTLVGMMLDQGTTTEDKFAIAEKLERVGATISFSVDTQTVVIDAKCLKQDVPLVVGLIAEQLRSPAFSAEEFAKVKQQFIGGLQRQLESTDFRAGDQFTRAVYPIGHPNRQPAPEELLAAAENAKLEDAKAFHAKYYGPAHFTLVAVGDLDVPQLQAELGKSFAGWTGGSDTIHPAKATATDAARNQDVFMADKTSVSVIIGQSSGLRYSDPDYLALRTGTAILGSGFTGRLMANVRDKEGLTYGISSRMNNDAFSDGDWRIGATFAPALLDKGIASAKRQLDLWHTQGVTDAELEKRKGDLIGSFKVSLATTDGMASALLAAVNRGLDVTWLDEYPKRIAALTTPEVNGAIKKYVKPETMFIIKAGTIPGATPAAAPAKN
ncbi:MAG: insulinase family protein [Verrucomicrobia bacterium]|nr:insulinase family protein [Verrucomicrobiota bacterium]